MRRNSLPIHLTIAGTLAACFGLLIPFLEVYFLLDVFIWIIVAGSILASIGLVMWSLRFGRLKRLTIGASLLSIGLLSFLVAFRNFDIWGLFFFIAAPTLVLGAILVLTTFLPPGRPHVE